MTKTHLQINNIIYSVADFVSVNIKNYTYNNFLIYEITIKRIENKDDIMITVTNNTDTNYSNYFLTENPKRYAEYFTEIIQELIYNFRSNIYVIDNNFKTLK